MESRKPAVKDYYGGLGVPSDATTTVIKKAYRELAQRHHPDRLQSRVPSQDHSQVPAERMIEINEAFAVLSDRKRRAAHDREREAASKPAAVVEPTPAPADWEISHPPTTTRTQTTAHSHALDQTMAQDFLQKLKT